MKFTIVQDWGRGWGGVLMSSGRDTEDLGIIANILLLEANDRYTKVNRIISYNKFTLMVHSFV